MCKKVHIYSHITGGGTPPHRSAPVSRVSSPKNKKDKILNKNRNIYLLYGSFGRQPQGCGRR